MGDRGRAGYRGPAGTFTAAAGSNPPVSSRLFHLWVCFFLIFPADGVGVRLLVDERHP